MTVDRNNNSSRPRKYALTAAPFVIGVVALYNWVISPHVGYLHAMQRLEPVMGRMVEKLDIVCGDLDEKLATMRMVREKLTRIRAGLFTPEESRAFIHDLQTLVETTGCVMIAADFASDRDAPKMEDPNAPIAIETSHAALAVAGQYDQIVSLLQTLRERPQKIWVDSCHMDLLDPRTGRLECRLGLTIYAVSQPGGPRQ